MGFATSHSTATMDAPTKVGLFTLILLALVFALVFLLTEPSTTTATTGSVAASVNVGSFVQSPGAEKEIPHHALAEHANLLSSNFFNSYMMLNRAFSPLSVAYALAIVQAAAAGETASELSTALGGEYSFDDLRRILKTFEGQESATVRLLNYWTINNRNNTEVSPSFVSDTQDLCVISVDDYDDHLRTISTINKFFADRTENHVNGAAKSIRPATSSVLISALYFQARWQTSFDPRLTRAENFTQHVGSVKAVHMMRITDELDFFQSPARQLVEVPFTGSEVVLGLVLDEWSTDKPRRPQLDLAALLADIALLRRQAVKLSVPRFKHRRMTRANVNLRAMGVKSLFDAKKAELPRLSSSRVHVTEMIHEAMLHIDELGGNSDRAAHQAHLTAATAAATTDHPSLRAHGPTAVVMHLNRTFVYYLRHRPTNTFLLIGDYDHA